MEFAILATGFLLSTTAGCYARRLHRSGVGWTLLSLLSLTMSLVVGFILLPPFVGWIVLTLLVSPVLCLVFLFALGEHGSKRKPCPACAESILPAATLCPHCRTELAACWADERLTEEGLPPTP